MVALGVVSNEWLLGWLLGQDGVTDDPEELLLIRVFQAFCLTWGLFNVAFYRFRLVGKLNLSMIALCFASPLLGEAAIRFGIVAGFHGVRRPGLYADPLSDDDYWKLRHLWLPEDNAVARRSQANYLSSNIEAVLVFS